MSSALYLWCILFLVTLSNQTTMEQRVGEWAQLIGKKIWNLTEDIAGSDSLKKNYEESLKKVENIDVERLLKESAQNIELYFGKKIESLERNQARVEKAYKEQGNQTVTAKDVKYVDMVHINSSSIPVSLVYDKRFKRKVNTSYSAVQVPANIYNEGANILRTIKWSSALDEVFIENFQKRDPTLKWQYFGSHNAVFRSYPAKSSDNPHYSARRRPWYIQGAASPKNIVILIDRSGSMVGQTSFIARLAVSNLIDTLSENDFFNVLYFNDDVTSLSCNSTLIQATKHNREWFKNKLISSGFSNPALWEPALTKAFETLKKSSGADCQKVIMIFTDGTEEKCEQVFEKYNKEKKIRVFTYLVGTISTSPDDLIWMACSNKGYYYRIPTVGAVRDLIEDYVSVLSRPMATVQRKHPVWTGVYRDASGLGMMVTGTLPVFANSDFLGVCGTDVTVDELEHVVYQPYLGADGYSFLINNNGHIVRHPNLRSTFGYVKSTGDVDITEAEFVPNETKQKLMEFRKKMLSMNNDTIESNRLDAFSFTEYNHYLRAYPTQRKYFYTRLNDTPFSLAIASSQFGYKVNKFQPFFVDNTLDSDNGTVFLDNWKHCSNVSLPETTTDGELRRLLEDGQCNDSTSSRNLLLDLNITRGLEKIWNSNNFSQNISFAFVKTHLGLLRITDPSRAKDVTKTLFKRIHIFPTDHVIVAAPYNKGDWTDETDPSLLVYRGVYINVSKLTIIPAVSGFQINEENFVKGYLINASLKDSYHVYLLDENAFIVSSSLSNSGSVTGKFLGGVDWELMADLENGNESLFKRFTFRNEQGECPALSSKTSSSSTRYTLYSTIGTFVTSWTKKVLACVLQLNLYNWFFIDAATSVTSIPKSNRSCVTNMTTYFGDITTWKNFSGNTSCLNCGDFDTIRRFYVSPVPRTNLVVVMVEYFENKTTFQYTKNTEGIPGKHKEIKIDINDCQSNSNIYRRPPIRCVVSKIQEKEYDCGKAKILQPNICLLMVVVFYTTKLFLLYKG